MRSFESALRWLDSFSHAGASLALGGVVAAALTQGHTNIFVQGGMALYGVARLSQFPISLYMRRAWERKLASMPEIEALMINALRREAGESRHDATLPH